MIRRLLLLALLGTALYWLGQGERLKFTGTLDGDPFSSFLVALVLASLLMVERGARTDGLSLLVLLAVSTRNLLLVALALAVTAFALSRFRAWSAASLLLALPLLGGTDLARLSDPSPWGVAAYGIGLLVTWLALHREGFRRDVYAPAESVHASFVALVVVAAALMRLDAWLPDYRSLEWVLSIGAVLGLTVGGLGVCFAEDRRILVRWAALSQAGYACLFVLGGAHARPAVLALLVTSGFALHAIAGARHRALLLVGAAALVSAPPFPGFAFKIGAASTVVSEGHGAVLAVALMATILLGVGCIRYVCREERLESRSPVALGIAAVALVGLGVLPEPLIRLAMLAASGLF